MKGAVVVPSLLLLIACEVLTVVLGGMCGHLGGGGQAAVIASQEHVWASLPGHPAGIGKG